MQRDASMNIDAGTFRSIAHATRSATLSPDEADAIVQLCFLVTEADLEEDEGERTLREQLARYVAAIGGIDYESVPLPSPLPLPIDIEARLESLRAIVARLRSRGARELAYVLAYLLAIEDLALSRPETSVINDLQDMLGLDDLRASELVAQAIEQATPLEEVSRV